MATGMSEYNLIDAIERYIRGEMTPAERVQFEQLRKTNADIDQQVVEHTYFMKELHHFAGRKKLKSLLNEVHWQLSDQGQIHEMHSTGKAKFIYLWKRYRRVAAIAAVFAGLTTLGVISLISALSPNPQQKIQLLKREFDEIRKEQKSQKAEVKNLREQLNASSKNIHYKSGGTGFLLDEKGFIITNAHIIRKSKNVIVSNYKGEEFSAKIIFKDEQKDLAILKVDDKAFTPPQKIPYGFSRLESELAEPVFTLGYPRNEIVYTEGYLSALTGFNNDSLTCQLGISANRGNSGGPVFNRDGEIIGILSNKETEAEGVVFAIRSKYIFHLLDEFKKENPKFSLKISEKSVLKGASRQFQVKKIQPFVFLVKGD
ncbi:MAG: serine protease [Chitinophagaceae bacterium]|nr:serine protease [Chitinophagaceae bacterium]